MYNCSMQQLAQYLTPAAGFPVADQTGLAGSYDIDFDYNPTPEAESDLLPFDLALRQATGAAAEAAEGSRRDAGHRLSRESAGRELTQSLFALIVRR